MVRRASIAKLVLALAGVSLAAPASAQNTEFMPTLNHYGMPGLIDMPTAQVMPDAELAFTLSDFGDLTRATIAFQLLPNVTGSFRYTQIRNFPDAGILIDQYDRSFDIHWQVLEERNWWPSVAVGIRDLAGTGLYSGEYVVATRSFGARNQFSVTAGLGWGRLGTRGGFTNPLGIIDEAFETRPLPSTPTGGTANFDSFFRGDAAVFGGIEWIASDRLRFQLEYSSDDYATEIGRGMFTDRAPVNLGVSYRLSDSATLTGQYMYGDTIGLSLIFTANPRRPAVNGTLDRAPEPVAVRPAASAPYGTSWLAQADGPPILQSNIERLFAEDGGLRLEALNLDANRATIRVSNLRYQAEAQALGRVLRVMSVTLPNSVETFEVIFVANGVDTSRIRVARTDVERFHDATFGAEQILATAEVEDAGRVADPTAVEIDASRPRLTWGIGPYIETALFDPADPLRFDVGLNAQARYEFGGGFVGLASARVPAFGNLSGQRVVDPLPPNAPPVVRSDAAIYNQQSDARIENLTLSHYGQLGRNLYTRVSAGYLERMFAGVSGELLWQRPNSEFGLGLEVNHVWQRAYDGGFDLREYEVTTGHVSAYFPIGDNFEGQVDVGRYLAGDWGATFRLDRTFANGWSVGAFATFTDVSFDEFGEGSFDKGIEFVIPLGWFAGNSTRQAQTGILRPILRDGGARLDVTGRLHDVVTDYHRPSLEDTEGMVWR